jgi:hypothetical protein
MQSIKFISYASEGPTPVSVLNDIVTDLENILL